MSCQRYYVPEQECISRSCSMGLRRSCLLLVQITTVILSLTLTFGQDCSKNECCLVGGYKEINDPRRSINSVLKVGQIPICDRSLSWNWYKFTSYVGGKIPTKFVNELRCGTVHPIWMKDPHPTPGEDVVERKVCVNFFNLTGGCFTKLNIKVKNCGSNDYVYYLGPTYSCSIAYCAGKSITVLR